MPQINEISWLITSMTTFMFFLLFFLISMNFFILNFYHKLKVGVFKIYFYKIMI